MREEWRISLFQIVADISGRLHSPNPYISERPYVNRLLEVTASPLQESVAEFSRDYNLPFSQAVFSTATAPHETNTL